MLFQYNVSRNSYSNKLDDIFLWQVRKPMHIPVIIKNNRIISNLGRFIAYRNYKAYYHKFTLMNSLLDLLFVLVILSSHLPLFCWKKNLNTWNKNRDSSKIPNKTLTFCLYLLKRVTFTLPSKIIIATIFLKTIFEILDGFN